MCSHACEARLKSTRDGATTTNHGCFRQRVCASRRANTPRGDQRSDCRYDVLTRDKLAYDKGGSRYKASKDATCCLSENNDRHDVALIHA